jgi:hypothetical protein
LYSWQSFLFAFVLPDLGQDSGSSTIKIGYLSLLRNKKNKKLVHNLENPSFEGLARRDNGQCHPRETIFIIITKEERYREN